jgi:hypothetical protein
VRWAGLRWLTIHLSLLRHDTKPLLTNNLAGSDHITTTAVPGKENEAGEGSPTVRFASVDEEIEPDKGLDAISNDISGKDVSTLKELSKSLQGAQLQGRRMSHFAFEPVSLPASRVRLLLSSVNISGLGFPNTPRGRRSSKLVFMIHAQNEQNTSIAKCNHLGVSLGCRLH